MTVSVANAQADMVRSVNAMYELKETHAAAILADTNPIYDSYASDNVAAALKGKADARKALVDMWDKLTVQLRSQVVELARATGYPTESSSNLTDAIANYVLDYLTDTGQFTGGSVSKKVTARGITRGTLNSPTGVTLYRLTEDARKQDTQVGFAEPISVSVASISSSNAGATVALQSEKSPGTDIFDAQGSGAKATVNVLNELTATGETLAGANLLTTGTDGATITAFSSPSWTLSGTWLADTSKTYRTLAYSVETAVDGSYFSQAMPSKLAAGTAYLPYIICNPTGFTGSVSFQWGGETQATISVGSDGAWNIVTPDIDGELFPEQFDSATGVFKVTVNTSGGSLVIARAGLVAMTGDGKAASFGSRWAAIMSDTTPVLDANSTITDTLSLSGKIADIFATALDISMPVVGSNAIADPA